MICPQLFFEALNEIDIKFYTGVPDSLLNHVCGYIDDKVNPTQHIIATNEGSAVALGIGYHLSTGKVPLVYMQNSGLGNALNPLLSLADSNVYSIPVLLMIGWRGKPNENDEPQHKKQGEITLDLLDLAGIKYQVLTPVTNDSEISKILSTANEHMQEEGQPFALVVQKGSFKHHHHSKSIVNASYLHREDAIKILVDYLPKDSAIVSTTGVTSRELFEYRKSKKQGHKQDFLTVGGMGHASQIALSIALQQPDRNVYCFDGDGAMLMHMGALAINGNTGYKNFKHILFNNSSHDSVGGQPTIANRVNIPQLASSVGYDWVSQAVTSHEIINSFIELNQHDGNCFLEILVQSGFRRDLGRPNTSPIENKEALMQYLLNK